MCCDYKFVGFCTGHLLLGLSTHLPHKPSGVFFESSTSNNARICRHSFAEVDVISFENFNAKITKIDSPHHRVIRKFLHVRQRNTLKGPVCFIYLGRVFDESPMTHFATDEASVRVGALFILIGFKLQLRYVLDIGL